MKRKIEERSLSILEQIVGDSLHQVGLEASNEQTALLLRLIFSGIGNYFFFNPDTKFRIGFIDIMKSPNIDELFNVNIVRSKKDSIVNAEMLYKYYRGDLARENQLKEVLDAFVNELLAYAQGQEISIATTMNKISSKNVEKHNRKD